MQRKSTDQSGMFEISPIVHDVLKSPGVPLDPMIRTFYESRLGHDFSKVQVHAPHLRFEDKNLIAISEDESSEKEADAVANRIQSSSAFPSGRDDLNCNFGDVRIHNGAKATEAARAINARAFTFGRHIVFGSGEYRHDTISGMRLIAHELSHVIQQKKGRSSLQCQDAGTNAIPRKDVAVVLDEHPITLAQAKASATEVIRAFNDDDLVEKLKNLNQPIGTLRIFSHSSQSGYIVFESPGGLFNTKLSALGSKFKGAFPAGNAPSSIELHGCNVGQAEEELSSFQARTGAKSASATNCFTWGHAMGPIRSMGNDITKRTDLDTEEKKTAFNADFPKFVSKMKSDNGVYVGNCIMGLRPGQIASANIELLKDIYFRNEAKLVAEWASPGNNKNWQNGSICFKDLTANTAPCKLIIKKAEAMEVGDETETRMAESEQQQNSGIEETINKDSAPDEYVA
jgi:hypothetical protein